MKADVQALLDEIGWSHSEAARQLGFHRNTVGRWVRESCAPLCVVRLLTLLLKHRGLLREYMEV